MTATPGPLAHRPYREEPPAPAYLPTGRPFGCLTADVADPVLDRRFGWLWWVAFGLATLGTVLMAVSIAWLLARGVGVWGIDTDHVWGFAIANYVWWIGIGNAGTLISSMLLLTRQKWRASISRFAEAMTLFAAAIAGLFPILHLGRPWFFYWLVPYPNTMQLWPQWRSPLVWDLFAIASYLIFSILFWYAGAIPDFATMRDRARGRFARLTYGSLALGWRGSARHWKAWEEFYWTMAALGVPLVISVHSVVGLDFAAGLAPGWNESIFPPYFVVGAMFSGFAMVVVLAALIRRGLRLERLITLDHFDVMGRVILLCALVMTLSYATEWFFAWYSGKDAEREVVAFALTGPYAPFYWTMLACNCAVPQLLWARAARRCLPVLLTIAILINVGMWLERILLIELTLSRDHLPSTWGLYAPTLWDAALLLGTLAFFAWLFLIFVRLVPAASIHEVKQAIHESRRRPA